MAKVEFSEELADTICALIESGESVHAICKMNGMPNKKSVFRWLAKNPEFQNQYRAAKMAGIEALVDQMMDIARDSSKDFKMVKGKKTFDGDHVQRDRLKIDTIKWVATKLVPRLYGDTKQINVDVEHSMKALSDEQLKKKIVSLQSQLYGASKPPTDVEFEEVVPGAPGTELR